MPFKSKAQIAKFAELVKQGKMSKETFNQWKMETPSASTLPNKLGKKTKKKKT